MTSGISRLEELREFGGAHERVLGAVVAHERGLVDRAGELREHRAQRVVALVTGDGARGLLLGEQDLVDLLAGADAGDHGLDVAVADEVGGEVGHLGAGALRDVGLAGRCRADRREDRVDGVLEREQEARHVGGGDGDRAAGGDLVEEQRHDRAARGEHVAVAGADEAGLGRAHVAVDVDALLDRLGHAHDVDGLAGLVGGDAHDRLDGQVVLGDGAHEVLGAFDVGPARPPTGSTRSSGPA